MQPWFDARQVLILKGQFIIEYIGELIRPILCDPRERFYDSKVRWRCMHVVNL